MKTIIEKLKKIILSLEEENGPILVFALFLREDPLERWDIVVAASWLNASNMDSYKIIASKIQTTLNTEELMEIARIVILNGDDPVVSFFQDNFSITNGHYEEFSGEQFSSRFGFSIKRAYMLRCQRHPA